MDFYTHNCTEYCELTNFAQITSDLQKSAGTEKSTFMLSGYCGECV